MEGSDENNIDIDDFTLALLQRAKERSQVLSGKLKPKQSDQPIEKNIEKLEKTSSSTSVTSPTKSASPTKGGTRPILKPLSSNASNENDEAMSLDQRPVKKTVTTFDAMTGDTIVEAKTFLSDGEEEEEEDDEADDIEMEDNGNIGVNRYDGKNKCTLNNSGRKLGTPQQTEGNIDTPLVETTPQLSRTLKKLAEFHSNDEMDSPVHPHTPLETFNCGNTEGTDDLGGYRVSASRRARTSRLSALAKTINEWEDDTSHLSIPGSRFHETTNNVRTSLAGKSRYSSASSPSASSPLGLGSSRHGQTNGVRLFSNKKYLSSLTDEIHDSSSNYNNGSRRQGNLCLIHGEGSRKSNGTVATSSFSNSKNGRLGFEDTVLTKLKKSIDPDSCNVTAGNDDWDEALLKSLELQGFSRKQGSPMKQIREKTPDPLPEQAENESIDPKNLSPKKTYFGGSPSRGSPYRATPPKAQFNSPVSSPARLANVAINRSPIKSASPVASSPARSTNAAANKSPIKSASPAVSSGSNLRSAVPANDNYGRSVSPIKSPVKQSSISRSPCKTDKVPSNESTPSGKPVSAIRMRFETGGAQSVQPRPGPVKPERSRLKPYSTPVGNGPKPLKSTSPTKKFNFGEPSRDPCTLSVAERAKMFESSKFCPSAPSKKTTPVIERQPETPTIFTSSPCVDNVKPQEIDVSVVPVLLEQEATSPKKRPAPQPPSIAHSPVSYGKGPAPPPPPPPMPTTSTPTNNSSKRRSTSPARSFPKEAHSVKRIKVNAPKPGKMYPSLTDIETETETEGHCSDVESMDDSIGSQQSLGAEIETIAKACSPIRPSGGARVPPRYRPSEDFSATFACAAVDALIDEALEGQDMTTTTINCSTDFLEAEKAVNACSYQDHENISENDSISLERTVVSVANSAEMPSQCNSLNETPSEPDDAFEAAHEISCSEADTTASSSFTSSPVTMSNFYSKSESDAAMKKVENVEPVELFKPSAAKPESYQTDQTEEEVFVPRPLVHTVSFYRKQQQQQKKNDLCSGLNDISEQPEENESVDELPEIQRPNIGEMIKKLEGEVEGRNLAIAQASKALNWCKALIGFSDSTEYIECERILLIETQRRLALLNSIHRLKTEGALNHQLPAVFSPSKQEVTPSCKGNMKIYDIVVNLRREFFNAHRAENQYHFIGLIKNKHHIEHTTLLTYESQKQGSTLRFPNDFVMEGLEPDFQINLEVYYLESAKEYLPHEAKYRINAKKDSKQATMLLSPLLTPSKKGKGDHGKPQAHSPAGPDAIKSSSFKFCGGLSVDISSLQRTYWELDNASGPLNGGISLKVQCSAMGGVEHKGFLTLFEDVSGYGAWVRRWCRLGPAVLEFWKYPEDETEGRKPPLGTLNLHECVTSKVRPAPRDICARANTLLLVTTRAPHPNDKDTLVTSCHKGYTAVRHLISADTREERDVWCQSLNKALANLRAWDPVAKQSVDDNLF